MFNSVQKRPGTLLLYQMIGNSNIRSGKEVEVKPKAQSVAKSATCAKAAAGRVGFNGVCWHYVDG
jgi:hypothetical protein